ncbi:hypothetical protein FRB90_012524 [Tulasnella sp. 427]|nr:hypothetical protein FRB90_012524 [Tulasnella sp. 427]
MEGSTDTTLHALLPSGSRPPSSYRPPSPSQRTQASRSPSSLSTRISREIQGVSVFSEANFFAPQRSDRALFNTQSMSEKDSGTGPKKLLLRPMSKAGASNAAGNSANFTHHLFNLWSMGRTVGAHPSIPQEWVLRIGTAFAIGFQTILASSLGFVICQLLWFYTRRQYLTINDINTLYLVERKELVPTVMSGAFVRSPLLVTATLLSFLLPIAAVFSPASLGVVTSTFDTLGPCQVSAGNFSSDNTPAFFRHNATAGNYLGGTVSSVQRMADSSFASGTIPQVPRFCGNNCTYQTSLPSMTFQCQTNVALPPGSMGDITDLSYHGTGMRMFWNASMAGPQDDPPSPFYVGWQTGAMYFGFDGSVGTNGTALCTPMKAQYDFTANTTAQWSNYTDGYGALQLGAITLAARSRLLGEISWWSSPRLSITNDSSPIMLASFLNVSKLDTFVWGDVVTGIEETAANVTAGMLNVDLGMKESQCTFHHSALVYRYRPENLWLPYGIALGVVGAALVLGVVVFLRFNPDNLTTSFIDTIGVTRNAELDSLALRYRLGLSGTLDEDESEKFRLGPLGEGYVGFGTKESIRSPE